MATNGRIVGLKRLKISYENVNKPLFLLNITSNQIKWVLLLKENSILLFLYNLYNVITDSVIKVLFLDANPVKKLELLLVLVRQFSENVVVCQCQ